MEMKRMNLASFAAVPAAEMSELLGSGLGNKKPHGYVEPKRLSVAKQKTKKQRAKMAKTSKRANRSK